VLCQDPASTSPLWLDRQCRLGSAERALLLTLPAYSHFRCIHMSGVGSLFSRYPSRPAWSLRGSSHTPCVGSLFSRYPSRPAWSLCGSSHTPCVGSLFSRYPSRPVWFLRGSSHTPSVVSSRLFSHALHGLVVLVVSLTPGVVSSQLFSHALRGLVVLGRDGRSAGHGDREVGLWRAIKDCVETNLQINYRALPLYFSFPPWNHSLPARLTQFLHSSS